MIPLVPFVGGAVMNMAKAAMLKKALAVGSNIASDLIEGVKGGVSSRAGEKLVEDSYSNDRVHRDLLVYSRVPKKLQEDAVMAADSINQIGGSSTSQSVLQSLGLLSSVSSISMAISTSFAKDHKAILSSIAPGFDTSLAKILKSTAEQFKHTPKIADLFGDFSGRNKLVSGLKTGSVETTQAIVSAVMPMNILSNSEYVLDKNARVAKKFGTQNTASAHPTPKPNSN